MIYSRNCFATVCWLLVTFGTLNVVLAKRFCGNELASALNMLCAEFVSWHDVKKSEGGSIGQHFFSNHPILKWPEDYLAGEDYVQNLNAPAEIKNRMIGSWFPRWDGSKPFDVPRTRYWSTVGNKATTRFRRAVAEECCDKDCSMSELMSYCKVVAPGVLGNAV